MYLKVLVSGTAHVSFIAGCVDTCSGARWDAMFKVTVSGNADADIPIPAICAAIAFGAKHAGKNGGSSGRERAGGRLALFCRIIFVVRAKIVTSKAKSAAEDFIIKRATPLIDFYNTQGATKICGG